MSASILSNTQASSITRNIKRSIDETRKYSSRLATGKAIVVANDDAAGLSIGAGLRTDANTLKTALTTAGQARLALNIADGALESIGEILERQKSLAVQANSGAVSDTERGFLNQEFNNCSDEINRLTEVTEFNGIKLIDGSIGIGDGQVDFNMGATTTANGTLTIEGEAFVFDIFAVPFSPGVGQRLDSDTGGAQASAAGKVAAIITTINANNGPGQSFENITASTPSTGMLRLESTQNTQINFSTAPGTIPAVINYSVAGAIPVVPSNTLTTTSFAGGDLGVDFQVGLETDDEIRININGVPTTTLFNNLILSVDTADNAVGASDQLDLAIDTLKSRRAQVGSLQSRFEFAAANIATSVQNNAAASAAFLDADIAAESTMFAQVQVRMQAGISILSQINQLPEALVKLIG